MLTEKDMEEAIAKDAERYLGEIGLKLASRQYRIGSYVFDLLFEDRHGGRLIVELQRGTLDRVHTYKILDYYDEYKSQHPREFVDLMMVANLIPAERKRRLTDKGIAFREIPVSEFPEPVTFPIHLAPEREEETQDSSSPSRMPPLREAACRLLRIQSSGADFWMRPTSELTFSVKFDRRSNIGWNVMSGDTQESHLISSYSRMKLESNYAFKEVLKRVRK